MKRRQKMRHQFVEFMPETLDEDVVYVSIPFATASHRCCCGCGNEVVTPLSPTDWSLIFDGVSISLDPSIGNWSFPCQSHYWIRHDKVKWALRWSKDRIETGRSNDNARKEHQYSGPSKDTEFQETESELDASWMIRFWRRFKT